MAKKDKIKAIYKRPGEQPKEILIENDLQPLQELVHGYIEAVYLEDGIIAIVNEEGRLLGMEPIEILGCSFVGPILLVGESGEEFDDVPVSLDMVLEWEA